MPEEIKKVGVACDNYKLPKFKKQLKKKGFTDFEVHDLTPTTSLIQIRCKVQDIHKVKKICTNIERILSHNPN